MTAAINALRLLFRPVSVAAITWISVVSFSPIALGAPVEFACGTAGQGGSFYSETGQQICETKGGPHATTTKSITH